MRAILKPIFDLLTGEYTLFNNVLYNYVAMAIIGLLAYAIAFRFVGDLYRADMIFGKNVGSLVHWVSRYIIFIVIFYLLSTGIWLTRFIMSIPWWGWVIASGVIILLIVAIETCKMWKNKIACKYY